jgi:SlyX protein
MSEALERRLIDLEARIAHHERMAEELSAVIYDQGKTIDALLRQLQRLKGRILEMEDGGNRVPPNEKPPHY